MIVNIKKLHKDAVLPKYSKPGDAGLDLVAISRKYVDNNNEKADFIEYGTGLSFEIPNGYVGLIFPRSSNSNVEISLANCVGVLDSGYRGEVICRFKLDVDYSSFDGFDKINENVINYSGIDGRLDWMFGYAIGDKVAQLIIMPYPQIEFNEVEELSDTERGDGGFGSTGK